jgi:hypothetical protein
MQLRNRGLEIHLHAAREEVRESTVIFKPQMFGIDDVY